ncbi:hypothetical protein AGMMS49992_27550 [Clostridia bacterium]|nr:hypothetical protein AGMMS49992_27550 [Clostridia bacterium]
MITGRWFPEGEPPAEAIRLWSDVFAWDQDGWDEFTRRNGFARAVGVFDPAGRLAAAGRMYYLDGAFWLEALAVRADSRRQGYGDLLARMMLDRALRHAARVIRLASAGECAGFFERYGFEQANDGVMMVEAENVKFHQS